MAKKLLILCIFVVLACLALIRTATALTTFQVFQGGTGSTTLSGIIIGNGTSPVNTLTIGSNLNLTGTTLSSSVDGTFSTTSADFWKLQRDFFSTTSAQYFLSINQGPAFSTTSVAYWETTQFRWATTSSAYFLSQNQGPAFSTSSASYFLSQNQGPAFSTTSANAWGLTKGYITFSNLFNNQPSYNSQSTISTSTTLWLTNPNAPGLAASSSMTTYASSTVASIAGQFYAGANQFIVGTGGAISKIGNISVNMTGASLQMVSSGGDVLFQNNANASASDIKIQANAGSSGNGDPNSKIKFFVGANEVARVNGAGLFGIATTTPFWALTVASSSGPQLALVDGSPSDFAWTARSISNSLYFATSTALATSTVPALVINPSGRLQIPAMAGCDTIDTDSTGLLSCGSDASSAATYPFNMASFYNATSTLTQFNGGLTAFASSTIGNSSLGGGLTISGGSTTTLLALFQGGLLINSASSTINGNATTTGWMYTNNASTTSFYGAGLTLCQAGNVLTYGGAGKFGCAVDSQGAGSYSFNQAGVYNATGTVVTFTGGLMSLASTTIGAANATSTMLGNIMMGNVCNNGLVLGSTTPLQVCGSYNSFMQALFWNSNTGSNASTDIVLNNNLSPASNNAYYAEYGLNGGNYFQSLYSAGRPNDMFFIDSDAGMNFELASSTLSNASSSFRWTTRGAQTTNIRMELFQDGRLVMGTSTPANAVFTIASSTGPQLSFSDNINPNGWSWRSISNTFYFSTSTVTATSTTPLMTTNGLTGQTNFASLTTTGYVGISSSTPWSMLSLGSGAITVPEASSTPQLSFSFDFSQAQTQKLLLNNNTIVNLNHNNVPGTQRKITACQDATGSRLITWVGSSSIIWTGGAAPTLQTGPGHCDIIAFYVSNATGTIVTFAADTAF